MQYKYKEDSIHHCNPSKEGTKKILAVNIKKPQEENNRSSLQFLTENLNREGNLGSGGRSADCSRTVNASESAARPAAVSTKTQVDFSDPSRRMHR